MGNFDHYPDMNRDGKNDLYDSGAFHNSMNQHSSHHNVSYHFQPSWGEGISMWAILGYEGALLKGSIPINGFTMFIGFILLIVFLYLLNETMVPW